MEVVARDVSIPEDPSAVVSDGDVAAVFAVHMQMETFEAVPGNGARKTSVKVDVYAMALVVVDEKLSGVGYEACMLSSLS